MDTTIQDAISTIMLRPDTLGWKRIRPANGIYEVWLGSGAGKRDWVGLPAIAGGAISDTFDRANETPLASPWAEIAGSTGDINLSSNGLVKSGIGDCYYYYNNAGGWNADQTSEIRSGTAATTFIDSGCAVRIGASGMSGYFLSVYSAGMVLGKHVSGSFTSITALASPSVANSTLYKVSVVGSTLRFYTSGVEDGNSPQTDPSLSTAGNGAGVFMYNGNSVDIGMQEWNATGEISATKSFDYSNFPKSPIRNQYVRGCA